MRPILNQLERKENKSGNRLVVEGLYFSQPNLKVILILLLPNHRYLQVRYGTSQAKELLRFSENIIHSNLRKYQGSEIEHRYHHFVGIFNSTDEALSFALAVHKDFEDNRCELKYKIGIHAGATSPKDSANHEVDYSEMITFAERLGFIAKPGQIVSSSNVHYLSSEEKNILRNKDDECCRWLFDCEGSFLNELMEVLEKNYHDSQLKVKTVEEQLSLSKSKLYRKCIQITGRSINELIREIRLKTAIELLDKTDTNLSQAAFLTGFSDPSYFSKSFKKYMGFPPKEILSGTVPI